MKNPLFKDRVDALFEKTALGQDPQAVLDRLPAGEGGHLRRGIALLDSAKGTAHAVKDIAGAGYRGLSKFVSPPSGEGGLAARGLTHAGKFIAKRPALVKAGLGAAALAPILGSAFDASQKHHEAELMNAYADPTRVITANLDEFLEKKAELYTSTKHAAAPKFNAGHSLLDGLSKGLGSAVGGSVASLLFQALGTGISSLHGAVSGDPKRKAMVEQILRTDPVLSDAIKRHPESKRMVDEAYGTMVRFAPTLSKDLNAVRSFLREAVLGGSGVNYATIKNLVDTERSISDAQPQYGRA